MSIDFSRVRAALNNGHTSAAALVYVGAKVGAKLGGIWWPSHQGQFDATAEALESAAVGYGFFMGTDARKEEGIGKREEGLPQKGTEKAKTDGIGNGTGIGN